MSEITVTLKIDWPLLREQKAELIQAIQHSGDPDGWGLVHLLDDIQDQAVDKCGLSEELVFGDLSENEA